MSAPKPHVRFYFDYISSNAYLAWRALPALAARHGAEVEPVPVLFAGLLEAHGQLGPAEVPAKAFWMWKNNLRKAALLGVPLNPPAFHPFNPLLALRASLVAAAAPRRAALIDGLFAAVWVRGLHVSEPEVVEQVAREAGLDGPQVIVEARAPEAKAQLRAQTEQAIAAGVFGVPSMLVGDEVFWGYDDLPHLALRLAGNDPLDPSRLRVETGVPRPSAVRRRFRQ
jgi:2-hydroxychromene-2-carboxylate isomerase